MSIVQNVSSNKRPKPRIPEYLRESFNLSELSEHISTEDAEAIPRHMPSNFRAMVQPKNLPQPSGCASSITSRASSNASQTDHKEITPLKSSSGNSQTFFKKVHSGSKLVLLPPSSFVRTTKPVMSDGEHQVSEGRLYSLKH